MGHTSGSGLGLSVVYGVVKDHKGYYDIITALGEGTEFKIYFPMISSTDLVREKEIDEISGNESILIVDDNEGQRDVAAELIKSMGYKTATAASGEEAIAYLQNQKVDLVLLDMIMEPGIDGLDTYREIIKIHPGQKAIIASGYSATERVEEMQSLGAGQYIRKPYTLNTLGKTIREELNRETEPAKL
jgi:CheY-like chemotaxis protein